MPRHAVHFTHPGPMAAWWTIRQISDYSSLVLMPLFIWYAGSRHLLRRWHGAPPPAARFPAAFWCTTAAVFCCGALVTWRLGYHGPHIVGVRLITALMLALLGGAAAATTAVRSPGTAFDTS